MTQELELELNAKLAALTLERKVALLTGADFWSLHPEPAIGLRRVVLSDGPAGVRGERWDERDPSANVPCPSALAATWDEARVERLGRLLAAEARRKGVQVLLAPTVNLHRTPYAGRHFECFSEDPLLTARIGAAYVRGVQAGGVAATVKHFVANDAETERHTVDVRVDERTLRELYLAPFEAIVREAGAWAVMAAYNRVNGTTMTEHPLLREVLKAEWGFDGVVMSDWFATTSTVPSARGGLDLVMPGPSGPWGDDLVAAVRAGQVSEAAIDDKVLRVLRLAARVGGLDLGADRVEAEREPWPAAAVAAELRATAAAGFVLLRNEPAAAPAWAAAGAGPRERGSALLPLEAGRLRRVAVLGPNAAVPRTLGGGSATVFPPYAVSPLDGLRAALEPGVEVTHAAGARTTTRVPAADLRLLRPPASALEGLEGAERGVELRFLTADGTVLHHERRRTAAFTWLGSFGDFPAERVAAIELRTRLLADVSGEYTVGCSGVGDFELALAGPTRFTGPVTLPPGAEPIDAMMRPPQRVARVPLEAGEEIPVTLRYGLTEASRIPAFQLNVERPHGGDEEELARAVALARNADAAIVVVGTTDEVESEGFDRDSLSLPGRQDDLVRAVAAANPRTVAVVNAGAPVLLPWAGEVPAILLTWFPGQEFGNALADVLLGATEPGGRLPPTWPASPDGLPTTTPTAGRLDYAEGSFVGHRAPEGRAVQYPFGHGLGYTTWEYLDLKVTGGATLDPDPAASVAAQVTVRNSGHRPGRELVQVYASRPDSTIPRPARWLAGFAPADAA
ncbi:MAG TPA: glycoside hydrolase family 3 C-terminal domain-containing protein, partial [Actinomycetota bacterium]